MPETIGRCQLAPGFTISRVLTGLWQIADMEREDRKLDLEATARCMAPYAEAGFTTFDMADHYGSAEEVAGHFKNTPGAAPVELLTKWVPKPESATRAKALAAVQRSLDRMQVSQLDFLQFHAWNYTDPNWLEYLFWLQEFKEMGLIRHLGVTNFDAVHLGIVLHSGIEIVSNQVCFSLLDQRAKYGLSRVCAQHGVKLLAFGTVAGGLLTEKWLDRPEPAIDALATWSQMKYKRFIDHAGGWAAFQGLLRVLHSVARRRDVSMANVACKAILAEPAVGGIIVGARLGESEHLDDNRRLFQFSLDEQDTAEIAEAVSALERIPGDCGDEYRRPPFLTASGDLSHHIDSMPPPYTARSGTDGRQRVLSGTIWEDIAGFSRAVRHDNRILVSGTTATLGERVIGGMDAEAQLHFVIDKIAGAIESLGGQLHNVVRTRLFIKNLDDWEAVARAHGARFRDIQPANTLVQASLIGSEYLVEMEAEAVVP